LVPLHATVIAELNGYANVRDRIIKEPLSNSFFMFDPETPVDPKKLSHALRFLSRQLGLTPRGQHRNFRVYDLRHTFIVRSFVQFHAAGVDVYKAVLSLSTYVGHSEVESTYWYVTGIPELMAIAAERFHTYSKECFNE
jgi:integrase